MIDPRDVPPMPGEDPDGTGGDGTGGDDNEGAIQDHLKILRIRREARRRLDDEARPPLELPPVKSLDVLLSEPRTPIKYRIDKVHPAGGRTLLSAAFKAGKTTLTGNLSRSLADKDPFLGCFDVHQPAQRLVIIDNELSEDTIVEWLRDQNIKNTAAIADVVTLRGRVGTFNLLDDKCLNDWVMRLQDLGCDYLILDCLRPILDALGLDENRDCGKFLVAYDALLNQAGITDSTVVQHMGHSNERARGDSRLQDWPDAIWRLVREDSEDYGSARFFSAYGRDVDVPEGRLAFNPSTRRLTYAEGSRLDAKVGAAYNAVIGLVSDGHLAADEESAAGGEKKPFEGYSGNAIEEVLVPDHPQKAVRVALKKAVTNGTLAVTKGPRNAKLHTIAYPCAQCFMPVASQRERHESCHPKPGGGVDGLFRK